MPILNLKSILVGLAIWCLSSTSLAQWVQTTATGGGAPKCLVFENGSLFAGTTSAWPDTNSRGGVFRSDENGTTWVPCGSTFPDLTVNTLSVSDSIIIAGTGSGVYVTSNRGSTWNTANNGLGNLNILTLLLHGTTLLAGTDGGGIYRSTDFGSSWLQSNGGLSTSIVQSLGIKDGVWFAGNRLAGPGVGIFRSTDDGVSWVPTASTHPWVTSFAKYGGIIYAGTYGGIYSSTDLGDDWITAGGISRPECLTVVDGILLAGTFDGVIYASKDTGATWQQVSGSELGSFSTVVSMTSSSEYLFSATWQGTSGVWRRSISEIHSVVDVHDARSNVPKAMRLMQNYPNPFNPSTTITYELPGGLEKGRSSERVRLSVCDLLGREVAVLVDDYETPGRHQVTFNAARFASGMYFYRLEAGSFVETKKLLLLR